MVERKPFELFNQLTGIHRFVRSIANLDWDQEINSGYQQFREFTQELTEWDRCHIHAPPEAQRTGYSAWKEEQGKWRELYEAASLLSDSVDLENAETRELWRAKKDEQVAAYAWSPKRGKHLFLLVAYKKVVRKNHRPTFEERRETTELLLLAAMLFAGGRAYDNRPIYYSNAFRDRFDCYERLEKEANRHPVDPDAKASCEKLMDWVMAVPPGEAKQFEDLVRGVFAWVFTPHFGPAMEQEPLCGGAKRIDIVYKNLAERGFWKDLPSKHLIPCPYVFVECKNYTGDVNNPEVDQLLGRFAKGRGQVGVSRLSTHSGSHDVALPVPRSGTRFTRLDSRD